MTIKTVLNEKANPYAKCPLIQEDEVLYKGRKYILKTYCKSYTTIEKVKKCFVALLVTLLTLGFFLIKKSFREEWREIINGTGLKSVRILKAEVKLDRETLDKAKELVVRNLKHIQMRSENPDIHFYNGKHCLVFSHTEFPGLILKYMHKALAEDSLKNLETARALVKEHSLDSCYIPQARMIGIDDEMTLFVMEKAPGITCNETCAMISECEYELFESNPEIKAKWRKYFVQAAELIARLGYWDTSWHNILLDKDKGFSFVDFEGTKPDRECIATGIRGLLKMAPLDFYEEIALIAQQHGAQIDIPESQIEQEMRLKMNAYVRKWHRENSVSLKSPVLNTAGFSPDFIEEKIIEKLNAQLNDEISQKFAGENLVKKRELFWQPLSVSLYGTERSAFDAALQRLKERKIICSWTIEENSLQSFLASFTINF